MKERIGRRIFSMMMWCARLYWRTFRIKTRGARMLLVRDSEVLLVRHRWGSTFALPGGRVKRKETFLEGAQREIREELHVDPPRVVELLGTYTSQGEGKKDTIQIFVGHAEKGWEPGKVSTVEIAEWDWYNLEQLPENISPGTLRRVQEYVAGDRNVEKKW